MVAVQVSTCRYVFEAYRLTTFDRAPANNVTHSLSTLWVTGLMGFCHMVVKTGNNHPGKNSFCQRSGKILFLPTGYA